MPADWNFASRSKDPSPVGSALFIALRAADVYLQYALIRHAFTPGTLVPYIGGSVVAHSTATASSSLFGLGLTPYHTLIVALAAGSAAKQMVWQAFISEQTMPPTFALVIAGFNTALNSFNTLLSLYSRTSAVGPGGELAFSAYVGIAMYVVGMALELGSEVQRKAFKMKSENKGKPCGEGLWGLATNVNYGGYALWRGGYACIAAGLTWGGFVTGGIANDFVTRAIPSMEDYLVNKVSFLAPFGV